MGKGILSRHFKKDRTNMNLSDSLSTFPEVFNEHYSLSHAKHVFSNMRDRCPKEYVERELGGS